MCSDGVIWSEMHVPMSMSWVLRKKILDTPNWRTAEVIQLDFTIYEMRTVKIFVDALYGCETEDADTEDLLKLLGLVDAEGSHEERD